MSLASGWMLFSGIPDAVMALGFRVVALGDLFEMLDYLAVSPARWSGLQILFPADNSVPPKINDVHIMHIFVQFSYKCHRDKCIHV